MGEPTNNMLGLESLNVIKSVSPNDEMYVVTRNTAAQSIALRPKPHSEGGIKRIAHTASAVQGLSSEIALSNPNGLLNGDLLLAVIASTFSYKGVQPPAGWIKILNSCSTAAILQLDSFYKVVEGDEPSTWTWQLNNNNARATGSIIVYRGVDSSDPIATCSGNSGTPGTRNSAPSLTTDVADCLVLGIFGEGMANGSYAAPSGFTEIVNITSNDPSYGNYHMVCDTTFSDPGITGEQVAISRENVWEEQYFRSGASALRQIVVAMLAAGKENFNSILDLPCGHGRVLRYIKARFPDAELTASDLNRDGVDFCAKTFGAKGVYSQENIHEVTFQGKFDLIWGGSIVTHLNKHLWFDWLEFFCDLLEEGGLLVFTTHGRLSVRKLQADERDYGLNRDRIPDILEQYENTGFGYLDYPSKAGYGISISSPAWVVAEIERHPQLKLVSFTEMGCDGHHDVVACVRS